MSIKEISPKELILPSWWNSYETNINLIWQQLVRLNSNIFVLEKLLAFRFDLFAPFNQDFWTLVEGSLFESSILVIWRIGADEENSYTIRQLKNSISRNLKSENYKREFKTLVKQIEFERLVKSINPAIEEIRHNYIAHFNLDKHINPTPAEIKERTLLFSELKIFRDALNAMFELLCFGHIYGVLPMDYQFPPRGKKADIEQLLDGIVKNSGVLNWPETDPVIWPTLREKWQKENLIEIINGYRIKFGLPEV